MRVDAEKGRDFLLRARDAARRFIPHRANVRARNFHWRPMAMRWRRRGGRLSSLIVRRVAVTTKVLSFPQLNFYLANHLTNRNSTNVALHPTSTIRVLDSRIMRAAVHPRGTSSRPSSRGTHDYHRRAGEASSSLTHRRDYESTQLTSKSSNPKALTTASARTNWFLRPIVTRSLHALRQNQSTSPGSKHPRVLHYSPPPLAARSQNHTASPSEATPEKKLPRAFYNTEELVWRRVSKATAEITERVRHFESGETARLIAGTTTSQQPKVDVTSVMQAVATTPIMKLHPALVDRLTDDVIRRMEKRIRIERERRGL